ncbi:hypothetical protein ALC62_03151 [Cyphomyrmex costatus]|uniref:Uncharacterized protein n=1 Tax=Cyphomyrmex costatus TaxID=456900 RepID=A0A151ILW8_9HYME|nr:hypothetical protein ALC62_03151 [Cyphomyrmex costatus]
MRLSDRRYSHGKRDQSTTTVVHHETDPVFLASDTFLVGGDLDAIVSASDPRVDCRIILLSSCLVTLYDTCDTQFLITRQHSLVHGTASATLTGSAHPRDPRRAPYPLSINSGTRST